MFLITTKINTKFFPVGIFYTVFWYAIVQHRKIILVALMIPYIARGQPISYHCFASNSRLPFKQIRTIFISLEYWRSLFTMVTRKRNIRRYHFSRIILTG